MAGKTTAEQRAYRETHPEVHARILSRRRERYRENNEYDPIGREHLRKPKERDLIAPLTKSEAGKLGAAKRWKDHVPKAKVGYRNSIPAHIRNLYSVADEHSIIKLKYPTMEDLRRAYGSRSDNEDGADSTP